MSFNHILYHKNGAVKTEMNIIDGNVDGIVNKYWSNGQLMTTCTYVNGMLHGEQLTYTQNGVLENTITYNVGKATHENGVLIEVDQILSDELQGGGI